MTKPQPAERRPAAGDFGRIPGRALWDNELAAAHLRVLGYVGFRDRTSRGCYATQATMALQLGLHRVTVADALGELERRGYVTKERVSRVMRYFVRWSPDDDAIGVTPEPVTGTSGDL